MGFRFRRSIKILPGVRLNVGKRGVSMSIGVRGAHVTIGHGKTRTTAGLPGTGISYTRVEDAHKEHSRTVNEPLAKGSAIRDWLWVALALLFVVTLIRSMSAHAAAAASSHWKYGSSADKMRGTTNAFAYVYSPYPSAAGARVGARIVLFSDKAGSPAVLFETRSEDLLFRCTGGLTVDSCKIQYRVDDRPVQTANALVPSNSNYRQMFIIGSKDMIEQLRTSKHLIVELNIYPHGVTQLDFETAGLDLTRVHN